MAWPAAVNDVGLGVGTTVSTGCAVKVMLPLTATGARVPAVGAPVAVCSIGNGVADIAGYRRIAARARGVGAGRERLEPCR